MGTAALGWSLRRGEVPASEEAPSLVGRSVGTEGELRGYRKRVQQLFCGRQDRVRPTRTVRATALCAPAVDVSPVRMGAACWNVEFGEQSWVEDCCWL